jgi:hypothetical protein
MYPPLGPRGHNNYFHGAWQCKGEKCYVGARSKFSRPFAADRPIPFPRNPNMPLLADAAVILIISDNVLTTAASKKKYLVPTYLLKVRVLKAYNQMVITTWKPDYKRALKHFMYATPYTWNDVMIPFINCKSQRLATGATAWCTRVPVAVHVLQS